MQGLLVSQILGLEDFSVIRYVKMQGKLGLHTPPQADLLCDEARRTIAVVRLQIKNTKLSYYS